MHMSIGLCRNSPGRSEYMLDPFLHDISFYNMRLAVVSNHHAIDSPTCDVRTAGYDSTGIYQSAILSTIMWYVFVQFINSFRSRICTSICMSNLHESLYFILDRKVTRYFNVHVQFYTSWARWYIYHVAQGRYSSEHCSQKHSLNLHRAFVHGSPEPYNPRIE